MNPIRRIAILGATSQIARDLIVLFSSSEDKHLQLFARRPDEVTKWLVSAGLPGRYPVDEFSGFPVRFNLMDMDPVIYCIKDAPELLFALL